jgi:hypothetical protein
MSFNLRQNNFRQSKHLDVSFFTKGIYAIEIQSTNTLTTSKITIQWPGAAEL